ncbi:MAG: sigma-70 family RNA polymerase sigma factor [Defluviitaleaceae bacterium]|nr:sigma-70 family RNA polymerase sigma factor [Defluviitaleaceae bacterium]MCL2276092.1 sigma-70 family RNA polymerase sigma factor [Defluviitaleaceae bacterium]
MDALLLRGVRNASERALEKIITKYAPYLCTVIRNAAGDLTPEDVEETAADTFFALWENAQAVQKLKPWLAATARNKALNKRRALYNTLPLEEKIACTAADTDLQLDVQAALQTMEMPDREIFEKFYFDGQSIPAITQTVNLSEAAVKQRLSRGRRKLREKLGGSI